MPPDLNSQIAAFDNIELSTIIKSMTCFVVGIPFLGGSSGCIHFRKQWPPKFWRINIMQE